MGVSYLEIYNEHAYDLLSTENLNSEFKDWKRLTVFEEKDGSVGIKDLSLAYCTSK